MQEMNIFNTEERFETLSEMEVMDIQGGAGSDETSWFSVLKEYVKGIFDK